MFRSDASEFVYVQGISKDRLAKISEMLQRSFLFNGLKIPYLDLRYNSVDEDDLKNFVSFHSGKMADQALVIANKIKANESEKKEELLQTVLGTLKSEPDYLSILKDVVSKKISIEEAIAVTGNTGVFQKGI